MIAIIAAVAIDNAIGLNNRLLWRLPDDMIRFRTLTTGHAVIMGRKTYESLPNGALPNRKNVVITRNKSAHYENCMTFDSLEKAINACQNDDIFIIGGASVYRQAIEMDCITNLYLTVVSHTFPEADAFFPEIDFRKWVVTYNQPFQPDERHLYPYTFIDYKPYAEAYG